MYEEHIVYHHAVIINDFIIFPIYVADSHRVLSQREAELLDSLDQCRGVMEGQVADLKKHSATQEHRLCSSQEEVRSLQEQLREKVNWHSTYMYVHCTCVCICMYV